MTDSKVTALPVKHDVARQKENIEGMFTHTAIYMIAVQSAEAFLQQYHPETGNASYTTNIGHAGRFSRKQASELSAASPKMFENAVLVLAPEFNSAIGECSAVMNEATRALECMLTEVMFLLREQAERGIDNKALWQAALDAERAQKSAINLFSVIAMKTIKRLYEDERAGQ